MIKEQRIRSVCFLLTLNNSIFKEGGGEEGREGGKKQEGRKFGSACNKRFSIFSLRTKGDV
jgi:hypothetical protein